jgi:APA family basic amino acid/polyamine antiporter
VIEHFVIIVTLLMIASIIYPFYKNRKTIFIKKPVEMFQEEMRTSQLKRVLGKWSLTALGVGAIIGAGIFVMTGIGAKEHAGPALALSFVISGTGCAFAALCYAEFASFLPVEGSAYAYSYASMGEFLAWIIGWDLILEYAMASSAVAVGWSGYMAKFLLLFDIKFPLWMMYDSFTANSLISEAATNVSKMTTLQNHYSSIDLPTFFGSPFAINLPAFLIIWFVTMILIKGIKEAAGTNAIMVIVKVVVVIFIIIAGSFYIDIKNWTPFIPLPIYGPNGEHVAYGFFGIMAGAAYIFFAYIGFDTVSTHAGEAKNPQKDVPFGIILSLIICTILYILVALVLTGMVNYKDIDISAPIASAFNSVGLKFAVFVISLAAVAGLTSVLIVMLLGQSRVFFAMSKDGLLPKNPFGQLHTKFRTPYKANLFTGTAVSIVAAFTPINVIAELVNIGTLLAFVMVCGSVLIMRFKEPNKFRPFKTPLVFLVAPLGMLFNFVLMLSLGRHNWERLFFWLALGVVIYFIYGRKHSSLTTWINKDSHELSGSEKK